ncbi:MAG: NAD(P)-dependent oxidoreductase [Desulfobacteraceae bacterium]|nr:NAD(P)-dependent oxidoreductase [Desulfobacteraceae bacterium]
MNKEENTTALVTGATGFVGSHLARRLQHEGWDVHAIARQTSEKDRIVSLKNITWHIHDGTTNGMRDIFEAARPDIVFHLAAMFITEHEIEHIEPLISSNILFGTQLLEGMRINNVNKLINTGTSWQHYKGNDYCPVNLYAATKQAFEALLKYYVETTDLKVITLKLFDTYGLDDPRPKLISLLKRVFETQETLSMSKGEQLIDLVYIDDVVEAYIVATERLMFVESNNVEEYAVSSKHPITLKAIVEYFEEVTDSKMPIIWGSRPYKNREVMNSWRTGESLPGWKPETTIKSGIEKILTSNK